MTRLLIITAAIVAVAAALLLTRASNGRAADRKEKVQKPEKTARKPGKPARGGNWKALSGEAARVIEACGTERPFSGRYVKHSKKGTYTCARCSAPLFDSATKFDSRSGWPAFDDTIAGAVRELRDKDGHRVEIRCNRCDGHLGHVFRGERMTSRNTRHCVNSVSLGFSPRRLREAFFAGGCFWGVEHLLESVKGVVSAESGYMGGHVRAPRYKQVTGGRTGHAETVRVRFDPSVISYEALARRFFEIHDPTHVDRQGPDRGPQYRSAIFTTGPAQQATVHKLIGLLRKKGLKVATKVHDARLFWPAEAYHQNWYRKKGSQPYCHSYKRRF